MRGKKLDVLKGRRSEQSAHAVVGLCGKDVVEMNAVIGKNYANKRKRQPIIAVVV